MQQKLNTGFQQYYKILQKHFPVVFICPVGEAFNIVFQENKNLFERLYVPDTFHPSKIGTYLSSCCFWMTITKKSKEEIIWFPSEKEIFPFDEKLKKTFGKDWKAELVTEEIALYIRDVAERAIKKINIQLEASL